MKTPRVTTILLLAAAAAFAFVPAATARAAESLEELQARFKQRYPQIAALKQAGTIGEAATGFLEFVHPGAGDAAAQQLVQQDNADRTALYALLAARDGTTPEKVARINAERRFAKAKPGEWLKGADGQWKQKQ